MDKDPKVLLALLAVRMKGGDRVLATDEPLKTLKKFCTEAIEQKYLQKKKIDGPEIDAKGKPKKIEVYELTGEGRAFLTQAASKEDLTATEVGSFLQTLQREIETDRQKIHQEVSATLAGKGKGKDEGKIQKEIEGLAKDVQKIAQQLNKLEEPVGPSGGDDLSARIDQGFAALSTRLTESLAKIAAEAVAIFGVKGKGKEEGKKQKEIDGLTKEVEKVAKRLEKLEELSRPQENGNPLDRIDQGFSTLSARLTEALGKIGTVSAQAISPPQPRIATAHPPKEPTHHTVEKTQPPTEDLEATLKGVYKKLCLLTRYEDGLVELPELYDEVKKLTPSLTVAGFHRKLLTLEEQRKVELHILNEVRLAQEPEKAIHRNDTLYYFLLWNQP